MEKWEAHKDYGWVIDGRGGIVALCKGTTEVEAQATANLIVTAVNACIEINPENPLAAAETHKDLYEALRDIHDFLKSHGYRTDIVEQILAKARKK